MAIRHRTGSYWEKRSVELLTASERASLPHLSRILRIYDDAQRNIVRSVLAMYSAYYTEQGWDKTKLNNIAPGGDIKRFLTDMRNAGLDTRLPDNYKGRMTRLELLQAQIWGEIAKTTQQHVTLQTAAHAETVANGYNRTIYTVAKGIGSTPTFTKLDTQTINELLNTQFYGENYNDRIWGNSDVLAQTVQEKLVAAIATGQAPEKTIRELRERFGVNRYVTQRLVQTETNYFQNQAELKAYGEMGIEKYVWVATLDSHTDDLCAHLDGKVMTAAQAKAGLNVPPAHPNCRCTIRPYIGKDYEPETRIARDPNTGRNVYVTNMSYAQWARSVGLTP